MRPLEGLIVLEFEGLAPSLFTGQILADFGANVIFISRPTSLDIQAQQDKNYMNRGKRSIMLNINKRQHQDVIKKMIQKADVLIDPYRPGVLDKKGFGFEACQKLNPKLIYAALTGYGQNGPLSQQPGHDINYLSYSGMLSTFGTKQNGPTFPANIVADFAGGGTFCALGILIALQERNRTNKGQMIDTSMTEAVSYLGSFCHNMKKNNLWNSPLGENVLDSGAPFYKIFKCQDGKYMGVGAIEPKFYKDMLIGLGFQTEKIDEMVQSQLDFDTWPQLEEIFKNTFLTKTQKEWSQIFEKLEACVTPVLEISDLKRFPHYVVRNSVKDTQLEECDDGHNFQFGPQPKLSNHPNMLEKIKSAPMKNQHQDEILKEFFIDPSEIQEKPKL